MNKYTDRVGSDTLETLQLSVDGGLVGLYYRSGCPSQVHNDYRMYNDTSLGVLEIKPSFL